MKTSVLGVLNKYLLLFPDEHERQNHLMDFLLTHTEEQVNDWNNFDGHVVASGFV